MRVRTVPAFILAFAAAAPCGAATVEFAAPSSLRVTLDAAPPGVVAIRGPDLVGVDWHADGRRVATLPLLLTRAPEGPLAVTVDGVAATLPLPPDARPDVARVDEAAYRPLLDRPRGPSAAERRRAVLLAVAVAASLLMTLLLPRRRVAACVAVSIAWSAGLAVALQRRGDVEVIATEAATFHRARRDARATIALPAGRVPVFASRHQLTAADPRLIAGPDGAVVAIELTLARGAALAILPRAGPL